MTTKKTHISVAVDFDGLHHWADAQNFLEHPHQHRFSVRLRVATIAGDKHWVEGNLWGCWRQALLPRVCDPPSVVCGATRK